MMESADTGPRRRLARIVGIGLVNLATFTWATNMVLARWLRDDIGPLTLAAARFTLASVLFAVLLQRRPQEDRQTGGDGWLLLAMAICGVTIFSPTLYLGLRFTTAVNATLINGLGPLITGLLSALLIREPMSRRQFIGAIIALIGVAGLISGGSSATSTLSINIGDLITLGAVTLWALYSVLGRRVMRRRSALSATAFSAFLGVPLLLVAAVWEVRTLGVNVTLELILLTLYIGFGPTVVGFLAWNEGVRRLGSSGAMVFYNTLPLYGALLGFLLLGEAIGPAHVVGGALIVGGGLWAASPRRAAPQSSNQ
jgi:drug/metabolite transporter (DMT)-like permease